MAERISWRGGNCPVAQDAKVVVFLEGDSFGATAGNLYWGWREGGTRGGIIAYKVIDPGTAAMHPEGKPHSHYHKDVSHLSSIDVYRVLHLFGVTDQAIGHAAKKLLVAGGRGHKDIERDIQDVIDTLERWKEMRKKIMYKFDVAERFEINGRGTVFVVPNPEDTEDFSNLMHQTIEIKGDNYSVRGVECFAHNGTHFAGERIGLLVEPACT